MVVELVPRSSLPRAYGACPPQPRRGEAAPPSRVFSLPWKSDSSHAPSAGVARTYAENTAKQPSPHVRTCSLGSQAFARHVTSSLRSEVCGPTCRVGGQAPAAGGIGALVPRGARHSSAHCVRGLRLRFPGLAVVSRVIVIQIGFASPVHRPTCFRGPRLRCC